jgi:hypothetical protein
VKQTGVDPLKLLHRIRFRALRPGEKNLPAKADELLTEVLNKDPLVLASISAVPYFGSTLATFFSAKWLQIYQARTKSLFDKFGENLSELDRRTIKEDFFETDEGIDLLIKATEQSARTRSEEKRALIARILAGATSTDAGQGEYSPEEYLNIVADLTDKELEIARTIYTLQQNISPTELEPENKAETWSLCAEEIDKKHDIGANILPLLLNRLYSAGLLDLFYVLVPGSPIPTYWVSPTFEKLMEFLRLEAQHN